jgi:flagellar biosynthesis/type III secretory pathway M-ring protein FliF/YscJ
MNPKIAKIIIRMKERLSPSEVTVQSSDFAELQALIAEEQAKSAAKMNRQTTWLIRLTFVIAALTLILLFFTIMLYIDEYTHADNINLQNHDSNQNP